MGSRKRPRPKSKVEAPSQATQVVQATQEAALSGANSCLQDSASKRSKAFESDAASIGSRSSRRWYAGSTWPRIQKASPSTQLARETILAGKSKNATPSVDFSRFELKRADDTQSDPSAELQPSMRSSKNKEASSVMTDCDTREQAAVVQETGANDPSEHPKTAGNSSVSNLDDTQRPNLASGWFGWFGTLNADQKERPEQSSTPVSPGDVVADPGKSSEGRKEPGSHTDAPVSDERHDSPLRSKGDGKIRAPVSTSSWFSIWPASASSKPTGDMVPGKDLQRRPDVSNALVDVAPTKSVSAGPPLGSSWAFWSKDLGWSARSGAEVQEAGELAVAGESSQDNPAPAHAPTLRENKIEAGKQTKRGREPPSDVEEPPLKGLQPDSSKKKLGPQAVSSTSTESPQKLTPSQSPAPSKAVPANLLLPSFRSTYRLIENPSIIQQIARLLTHSQQAPANHVYLIKEPPKIKKALAIGIHGLFPAPLLRTVIGQPTGTSIRFANHAAAAIHRWADTHKCDCEVEKVALEGEGKIAERVDNLWKLLLNWIDHVRNADFILVACHSQGVPVALMLIAKLIEFGVVTLAKIGVCAMAGVSLGPFSDYKSRLFSGSAAELFEFANPDSEVSKRYEHSLRVALKFGVRITYVGSIDDQLVSLESAIFSPVNHPYIYRSVFVDGRVHAPDFIAHLVGFALKLRNLGVSDHGLVRELSVPLAGSLYTGEGHSRLYDEAKIYDVAVSFALETSSVGDVPLRVQKFEVPTSSNPFQLPWSMRGLLEEGIVKTELDQETTELLQQFDEWKPTTKVLKDVKYRLESVKSKL